MWNRRTWQSTLPEQHGFLAGLPDRLDRSTVAGHGGQAAETDEDAARSFVAAMVWGYGRTGYGAFRTARVLRENPNLDDFERALRHLRRIVLTRTTPF